MVIRQDSMMAGRDSRVWLRIFERTGQCCALNFMRPGQGMHNSVSLTIACSRRSRLSRRLLAQAPRQPSSLLKLVLEQCRGGALMTSRVRWALMTLVPVLVAGSSAAIDYFPTANGSSLSYFHGGVGISSLGNSVYYDYSTLGYHSNWHYLIDDNGDVLKADGTVGSSPDWTEINITYSPPVVYLDLPLEAGKTWSTTTLVEDTIGAHHEMVFEGTVVGPASVTIPAGTFDVIEVRIAVRSPEAPWNNSTEVLWLHRQLGQMMDLVQWSGIVGTAGTNWGDVKSLFR
ncbi:MAG: hypothetical protein IPJ24_17885 [bacterium]|nr:hypothetical protein [bacterium]